MKTTPYWWDAGAPLLDLPNEPPATAELLIVGAGFTGLSAAITAAKAGSEVVVVDAGIPGQGASSRNGGMAGSEPDTSFVRLAKHYGHEMAVALFNEATPALENLKALIGEHDIDCHYTDCGRIYLAWTKAQMEGHRRAAAQITAQTGYPAHAIERDALGQFINTKQYFGGLYLPNQGGLHPRKLHDGLLKAALNLGVQIIQNCPITDVPNATMAHWANGTIPAKKIILTTNGYTNGQGALRWLTKRVFPLPSFIIATEELPEDLLNDLTPANTMMVETRARHSYFRRAPDSNRILWGGRASMLSISPDKAARRLKSHMLDIWPQLQDVKLTHSWSGSLGFAFSHMPQVGQVDGVHYALGYSGSGVVLANYLGMKAAYQALGDAKGETTYSHTTLQTRPYHPVQTPHFVKPGDLWYRFAVDPWEAFEAKRDHKL